jgi:hypothetical protein
MKKLIAMGGSVGVVVLLVLSVMPSVVSTQEMDVNEQQINISLYLKEKMKNNDWKTGETLNFRLIKDAIKDVAWFPGSLIYIFFAFIIIVSMMFGFPII